jgi:hypothetical protein
LEHTNADHSIVHPTVSGTPYIKCSGLQVPQEGRWEAQREEAIRNAAREAFDEERGTMVAEIQELKGREQRMKQEHADLQAKHQAMSAEFDKLQQVQQVQQLQHLTAATEFQQTREALEKDLEQRRRRMAGLEGELEGERVRMMKQIEGELIIRIGEVEAERVRMKGEIDGERIKVKRQLEGERVKMAGEVEAERAKVQRLLEGRSAGGD